MLKEHILNETGLSYVEHELDLGIGHGSDYARLVLNELPLSGGTVSTYLPVDLDRAITEFDTSIAKDYQSMAVATRAKKLDLITSLLNQTSRAVLIVDTFQGARTSLHEQAGLPFFVYSKVYIYVPGSDFQRSLLEEAFRHGLAYPGLAYITRLSETEDTLTSGNVLSEQTFLGLVKRTFCILVEAYDQDGFVTWQQNMRPRH